jgi:hypothetical protein
MTKLAIALLATSFFVGLAYVGGMHLYDWYSTGQLAMHRKMPVGPDSVSYDSDPVLFVWEFGGNVFFFVMSVMGLLALYKDLSK